MSDALQRPPTFNEMVGLIEQNFKDVLRYSTAPTPERIEKAWERYKTLNHLYQDKALHPSESAGVNAVWVKASKELPKVYGKITWRWLDKEAAYIGYVENRGFIYDTGGASVDPLYYNEIEWLDESPSLAPNQAGKEDAVLPLTDEERQFMRDCNVYPHANGAAKILTENDEGAHMFNEDLLKLADILYRYAKTEQ